MGLRRVAAGAGGDNDVGQATGEAHRPCALDDDLAIMPLDEGFRNQLART